MLRISVNANRKVAGLEPYSSDGFHCQLELEVTDSLLGSAELERQIDHLYRIALDSVDQQIRKRRATPAAAPTTTAGPRPSKRNGAAASTDHLPATDRQVQFIADLGDQLRLPPPDLTDFFRGITGQGDLRKLTREQASRVIEELRARLEKSAPSRS